VSTIPAAPVTAPRTSRRLVRRGLFAWLLVRFTGLILTVLVIGHFALTHIVTDVAQTGSSYVASRWASALVVGWDWIMLAAAVLHGAVGLRVVIGDYAPARGRGVLVGLLVVLGVAMVALGTWTIARVLIG
jgi:succinate dehydrogenase / fumarate reductase membrane anchor subunit